MYPFKASPQTPKAPLEPILLSRIITSHCNLLQNNFLTFFPLLNCINFSMWKVFFMSHAYGQRLIVIHYKVHKGVADLLSRWVHCSCMSRGKKLSSTSHFAGFLRSCQFITQLQSVGLTSLLQRQWLNHQLYAIYRRCYSSVNVYLLEHTPA